MKKVPLGDFMVSRPGSVLPSNYPEESFELYSIPAHDRGGPEVLPGAAIGSAKQVVRPGDVMVSKIIPHLRRSRVVAERNGRRQVASGEWIVFRSDRFLPAYLRHYLVSDVFHSQFMNTVAGVGGSLVRARPEHVRAIPVPLPTLEEQRRIAAILDKADAIRAKRRQVLAHLDALTQAIFHDMFGPLPASATVADVALDTRTGPFGSQLLHSEFVPEGVAVLGLDNVVDNEFRYGGGRFITPSKYEKLKRFTVMPGDVLISIMGTIGRCVVVPKGIPTAINTKHICAVTPNSELVLPQFLRASFLWHPQARAHLRRQAKGSIMDGLNMGIIRAMPIPVPPMSEQSLFVARIEAISTLTQGVARVSQQDGRLFASLQSRAFKGKL